ncbi:hypothetical protein JTB14_017222 [Gonioctena quinquepunctata]|nr:hypothetical protein JTB14_017222 [Gonioctena quinquepunctata]
MPGVKANAKPLHRNFTIQQPREPRPWHTIMLFSMWCVDVSGLFTLGSSIFVYGQSVPSTRTVIIKYRFRQLLLSSTVSKRLVNKIRVVQEDEIRAVDRSSAGVCYGPSRHDGRISDSQVEVAPAARRRYVPSDAERRKRGFSRWTASHDPFQRYDTFSAWDPPAYQLSGPYYIPAYGAPGRLPIYLPPQSINMNPGFPPDNPIPFRGPPYLPPIPTHTMKNTTTNIEDRFNFYDDDDERPVWGAVETTKAPKMTPTRPPRPQRLPEFPPPVHDIGRGTNMLAADDEDDEPPYIAPAAEFRPIQPARQTPVTTTTQRPPAGVQIPSGPSNCVWAVISCCSAANNVVQENCFEQRGCPGPFWDRSPCDSDFARAAIATAMKYYNQ